MNKVELRQNNLSDVHTHYHDTSTTCKLVQKSTVHVRICAVSIGSLHTHLTDDPEICKMPRNDLMTPL